MNSRPGRRASDAEGVEHGLEVERRVHRLADVAERTQLFHRLGELAGAQLDLFFQIGVGRLKLVRHLVELYADHRPKSLNVRRQGPSPERELPSRLLNRPSS